MKEFNTIAKRKKSIPTRKLKAAPKAKNSSLPRRARQQQTMSWQLLIDRERMLI